MNPSGKSRPQYEWSPEQINKLVELIKQYGDIDTSDLMLARSLDTSMCGHHAPRRAMTLTRPPKNVRKVHPFFNTPLFTK